MESGQVQAMVNKVLLEKYTAHVGWGDLSEEDKKKKMIKFIGPSRASVEKNKNLRKIPSLRNSVIGPSWTNFNSWKKEKNFEGEDPKNLKVNIESDESGVYAEITCDSEEMMKLIRHNLLKHEEKLTMMKEKKIMNIYASFPHEKLGLLIGRGGSGIKNLQEEACDQMDEDIEESEYEACVNAYVKVSSFTPKNSFEDFKDMVESSDKNTFIGWDLEEEEDLIKISISLNLSDKTFSNFVECIQGTFANKISEMKDQLDEFSKKKKDELNEVMGVVESEW